MSDSAQEHTIVQMNRGPEKGKFYCYRRGGIEYFHSDGKWKTGAFGEDSTAYFESREQLERLLAAK